MDTAIETQQKGGLVPLKRKESWKSPLVTKTLGQLGAQLPVGLVTPEKKLLKDFSLKPLRWKEEKEIQKLKNKPGMNQGKFVTGVLSTLVDRVHGISFDGLKDTERALMIGAMWMPDVLYMYFYARVQSLGSVLEMTIPCRTCNGLKFDFDGDLNGMDVRVVDQPDQVTTTATLAVGIPYREGVRTQLSIRPIPWSVIEGQESKDEGAMRTAIFQRAIVGVDGVPANEMAVIPETSIDEMVKRDVETLTNHIERHTPGPQPIVKAPCPRCDSEWLFPINWNYESFFTNSSL